MPLYLSTSVFQVRSSNFSRPSKTILINLLRVLEVKQFRCFVAKRPMTEKPLSILVVLSVMRSKNLNNIINSGYSDHSFITVLYIYHMVQLGGLPYTVQLYQAEAFCFQSIFKLPHFVCLLFVALQH